MARSAAPSLPPVDDDATVPFSDLIRSGFDPATVDTATQLADRSIFIAPDGRRYRVERIPDTEPSPGPVPVSTSAPTPPAVTQPVALHTPSPAVSAVSGFLPPPPLLHVPGPRGAPLWGRSPSNASTYSSYSSETHSDRSGHAASTTPGPAPRSLPVHEFTALMAQLQVNNSHFGASALYGLSDAGAQAAETMTDPYLGPRAGIQSPTGAGNSPSFPRDIQQHATYHPTSVTSPYDYTNSGAAPQPWTNPNYDYLLTQADIRRRDERDRQAMLRGYESLMEGSLPMISQHRASDPTSSPMPPMPPMPPSNEPWGRRGLGPEMYHHPHYLSASAPPSIANRHASDPHCVPQELEAQPSTVIPQPMPPSASSDGGIMGRDNVLPGEALLFDGPVKSAQSLNLPDFRDGVLKVFRHTITNDLRFHCRVGHESENYRIKARDAQLVPVYAYDQRLARVVYIRDNGTERCARPPQTAQESCRPSGIYQFTKPDGTDLYDFQAKLTGERVVLDIDFVRTVELQRARSRTTRNYSNARLQIWHELEGRRAAPSDVASFVTFGTTLSGPLRERLVPNSSRLVLYLARSGEYITVVITDDLELETPGPTRVRLEPRKPSMLLSRDGSRWQHVKAHQEPRRGADPAGLDIHGQLVEVDIGSQYDSYKTFEIEFESPSDQERFLRKWNEVMRARRGQRRRIREIQDDMPVFTGDQALDIRT